MIGRWTLISGILLAFASLPASLRAELPGAPTVGWLSSSGRESGQRTFGEFRKGLGYLGYNTEKNVLIEEHWAEGHYDRLPAFAADLIQHNVNVIVATGSANSALAAKSATRTIPIVFANGGDPVKLGLVTNLGKPEANATGVSFFASTLNAKRMGLLRQLIPGASTIAYLVNPTNSVAQGDVESFMAAARAIDQPIEILRAATESEMEGAFAEVARQHWSALVVDVDAFFNANRRLLVALAERYRIPTSYPNREHALAGGLMSYSNDRAESFRQAGVYVARILNGTKPSELPVLQPTIFDFVINLRTAKSLGLAVPQSLLFQADEVIE